MSDLTLGEFVLTIEEAREYQSELFYKISRYKAWLNDDRRGDREKKSIRERLEEANKEYKELTEKIRQHDAKIIEAYIKFQPVYELIKPVIKEIVENVSKTDNYFADLLETNRESEMNYSLIEKNIEFFRAFFAIVERELKKFDEVSGQNYSKHYLLIGFALWKNFEKQIKNDDVIKFQIDTLSGIPEDLLAQYIVITESLSGIFETRPPEALRQNKRNIEMLLMFIDTEIELTSSHSYIIDYATTKRIYLTAILLQIVYPEEYPKNKYTNKKAINSAIEILGLDISRREDERSSMYESYRQSKKKFKAKYNLTGILK